LSIAENPGDLLIIEEMKSNHNVQHSLSMMRKDLVMLEYRSMRIKGIGSQCLENYHVDDCNNPGEKVEDEHNNESDESSDADVYQSFIISQESLLDDILEAIYVLCCLISPYFYAYLALHGHEEGNMTAIWTTLFFEGVFVVSILKNFITEYTPDGEIVPVKDIMKISERYFWNEFMGDLIPTIPMTFILDMSASKYGRIFYLVKIIRLAKGLKIYNV
jgi:hypothetical protein